MEKLITGPYAQARIKRTADGFVLEVLGAPYGGHLAGKDADGEFFSENTDFMLEVGDEVPVLFGHGIGPDGTPMDRPEVLGRAKVSRRDSQGLWFEVVLNKAKELSKRLYKAALEGLARASSGALNYLVRKSPDGELLNWPIGELTLIDTTTGQQPANQLATVHLKSAFDEAGIDFPKTFDKAEEDKADVAEGDSPTNEAKTTQPRKLKRLWVTKTPKSRVIPKTK